MNESQKNLLLYWSGEADAATKAEVKERLAHDPQAQREYAELCQLQAGLQARALPQPRAGLLDEVLAERPSRPSRSYLLAKVVLPLAACFLVMGGLFLWQRPLSPAPETNSTLVQTAPPSLSPEDRPPSTPLSSRLLQSSPPFANSLSHTRESRQWRHRFSKIHPPSTVDFL